MANIATGRTIIELAAIRQTILDRSFVNEATDLRDHAELLEIENGIEQATFDTDAEKLAGLKVLLELNDAPDFADQFKAKLFSRIHQFV